MRKNTKSEVVSVIIPVHNRHNLFLKSLLSITKQKNPGVVMEILIVDDNSTPSIKSFLRNKNKMLSKSIKIIENKKQLGPGNARNIGLKFAKGDYVYFLDSDDICSPLFVKNSILTLKSSKSEITTCFVKPIFADNFGFITELNYEVLSLSRIICFWFMYFFNNSKLDYSYFYMTRLSGMVFSRKSIGNTKFDLNYKSAEDWKFVLDIIKNKKPSIKIIPKFLVDFTYHNNSETVGRSGYWQYYYNLIKEIPTDIKRSIGVVMFILYTNFSATREKWLRT